MRANLDIIHQRLTNQHLVGTAFEKPEEAVAWQGAVQAQDYDGGKWAIGQRVRNASHAVEQAFNQGAILRTHVMRPTWHFVARPILAGCWRRTGRSSKRRRPRLISYPSRRCRTLWPLPGAAGQAHR